MAESIEHATMVQCADALSGGLSADLLKVSNKLFEVEMVPPKLVQTMQLPSRDDYDKATELVQQVTTVVENCPEKFNVFMGILAEFQWLSYLVEVVQEQYEINQKNEVKIDTQDGNISLVLEDPSEATNLMPEGRLWDKVKRLEREKEELGKEKKRLTHEIDSKNEELTKLMAVMRSMHETSTRNTKRSEELEADLKKIQQREENLKANIQLKEKEIESLKNQLALVNEKIKKKSPQRIPSATPSWKELDAASEVLLRALILSGTKKPNISNTSRMTRLKSCRTRIKDSMDSTYGCTTMCTLCILSLLTLIPFQVLPIRNSLISGSLTLGNSDVLPISRFENSVKEVYFTQKHGFIPVKVYQGSCSKIGSSSQLGHNTRQLQLLVPSQHRIDEPYMTVDSHVIYSFIAPDSDSDQASMPCIAKVHIFTDQFDYYQFIVSGRVSRSASSKCLSPAHPLYFILREHTGYYFVGLESFHPTTLNITINSNKLEYNATSFSNTVCNDGYCSIPLNHTSGQGTCVLAALNDSYTFVSLQYSARPQSNAYKHFLIAKITISFLFLLVSCILCACIW